MRLYESCDYLMRSDASCDECYRFETCIKACGVYTGDDCMNDKKDLAEKIYWILIKEGQDYLASIPLGQRMFFTPEDVKTIIRKHLDELR